MSSTDLLTSFTLKRRGFDLGIVDDLLSINKQQSNHKASWSQGRAILLKQINKFALNCHTASLTQANYLYQQVLAQQSPETLLDQPPYIERLEKNFEPLGSSINEGDPQEIETVLFDVVEQKKIVAEDLWMKVSWLSFYENDASLRFRFSFGVDLCEDVCADKQRQHYASVLSDAVFPESNIITQSQLLLDQLHLLLDTKQLHFVERIIYFNAAEGGAYLHHDQERGHAGVVYAQLTGSTFWLALSRSCLLKEILFFVQHCKKTPQDWPETITADMRDELITLNKQQDSLTTQLESFNNNTLIHLLNETKAFTQQLIRHGYGHIVQAGDVLLLSQESKENCCWHSVFTIGEDSGQALSFAIRKD